MSDTFIYCHTVPLNSGPYRVPTCYTLQRVSVEQIAVSMNGTADGASAVYVCILDDGFAVKAGASVQDTLHSDYEGLEWAIVTVDACNA